MAQTNKCPLFLESPRNHSVFKKYKEATCDVVCQLESVDDDGDFQRLSAYA
jgi:hypothetical protein